MLEKYTSSGTFCQLTFLAVIVLLSGMGSCGSPFPIKLMVKKKCEDWVVLTYQPHSHQLANRTFATCDVTYRSEHAQLTSIRVLYNYPTSQRDIRISNLTENVGYVIYMSCDNRFLSNNVTFSTGATCTDDESEESQEVYSTPVVLEDKGITEMSTIDATLGVIFGLFGAVILSVAAYYFWKNYQRRLRIQRVFGQTHTDPFEALHSSMDESSVISL